MSDKNAKLIAAARTWVVLGVATYPVMAFSEITALADALEAATAERDEARNVLSNISIAVAHKERKVGQPWEDFLGEDSADSILTAVQEWIATEDSEYEQYKSELAQRDSVIEKITTLHKKILCDWADETPYDTCTECGGYWPCDTVKIFTTSTEKNVNTPVEEKDTNAELRAEAESMRESRVEQLRGFIELVVESVTEHGGSVHQNIVSREVARKTSLSVSEMPYVIMSARADHRVVYDLRTGTVSLPDYVEPVEDEFPENSAEYKELEPLANMIPLSLMDGRDSRKDVFEVAREILDSDWMKAKLAEAWYEGLRAGVDYGAVAAGANPYKKAEDNHD